MSRIFGVVVALLALATYVMAKSCYTEMNNACIPTNNGYDMKPCNSHHSGINNDIYRRLANYASQNILTSFQYLLMSANFGNYIKNREGFMKLFRKLSDSTWDDAIDLIKYTTKRGGSVDLSKTTYSVVAPPPLRNESQIVYDATRNSAYGSQGPRNKQYNEESASEFRIGTVELLGLSRALDMHKHLANQAHDIHKDVSAHSQKVHDAEVMSYLEKEFVHKHADTIRNLAGYLRDVVSLSELENPNLAVFMFDEYLQKVV